MNDKLVKDWARRLVAGEPQWFDGIDDAVATVKEAWTRVGTTKHGRKVIIEGTIAHGYSVRMPFECAEIRENNLNETKPPGFYGRADDQNWDDD